MIEENRIKRFIEGAKEAFKEVDDPTFTFPINILSAYKLATSIEELLKDQDKKKGQWIPIESPTGVEAFGVKEMTVMNVRCSVCGSEEDVSFTGYKYCPRCGAKMESR